MAVPSLWIDKIVQRNRFSAGKGQGYLHAGGADIYSNTHPRRLIYGWKSPRITASRFLLVCDQNVPLQSCLAGETVSLMAGDDLLLVVRWLRKIAACPHKAFAAQALTAAGLRGKVKVMVGGAPVTQEFADAIGADGYAKDAATAVDKAKELLKK